MKKILLILLVLLAGCTRTHVYHTYYGDIDIDSLTAFEDVDGKPYYAIKCVDMDSSIAKAMGVDTLYNIIFFKPSTEEYFNMMVGNDGNSSARIYFDPLSGKTDSIR